ncbi:hypothetical protein Pmar_PMAR016965, partial [Perkinsus marinus ATCC 50983]
MCVCESFHPSDMKNTIACIAPTKCGRFAEFAAHGVENESPTEIEYSGGDSDQQQLMVDLVVCLGGDALPANSDGDEESDTKISPMDVGCPQGNKPMTVMPPPIVAFALGSLGFLTPHPFD